MSRAKHRRRKDRQNYTPPTPTLPGVGILPGIPGGPPLAPVASGPTRASRLILPEHHSQILLPPWVEERVERERRRETNPLVNYIRRVQAYKLGLPRPRRLP